MLLWHHDRMVALLAVVVRLVEDALRWLVLRCRSTKSLGTENLFLRRQLALYIERGVKPRRLDVATRVSLVVLSRLFDWCHGSAYTGQSVIGVIRPPEAVPAGAMLSA
jgi:hypothetical protein